MLLGMMCSSSDTTGGGSTTPSAPIISAGCRQVGRQAVRLTGWLPIHRRSQASLEDETTSKLRLTSEIETLKQQLAVQQQQIEAANAEAAAAKANAAAETKAKAAAEAKAAAAFRSSPEGQKVLPARLEMQRGDADVVTLLVMPMDPPAPLFCMDNALG